MFVFCYVVQQFLVQIIISRWCSHPLYYTFNIFLCKYLYGYVSKVLLTRWINTIDSFVLHIQWYFFVYANVKSRTQCIIEPSSGHILEWTLLLCSTYAPTLKECELIFFLNLERFKNNCLRNFRVTGSHKDRCDSVLFCFSWHCFNTFWNHRDIEVRCLLISFL